MKGRVYDVRGLGGIRLYALCAGRMGLEVASVDEPAIPIRKQRAMMVPGVLAFFLMSLVHPSL